MFRYSKRKSSAFTKLSADEPGEAPKRKFWSEDGSLKQDRDHSHSRGTSRKGLTFLEVVFALFILSVAMVGYSQIFVTAQNSNNRANHDIIASNLAAGLMAEIMARDFEEEGLPGSFGPDAGESDRHEFDDVDDYHNWSESPPKTAGNTASGGYEDMDGTTAGRPNYSNFTRSVTVSFVDIPADGGDIIGAGGPTNYKKVTVTVSGPFGKDVSIIELKTNPQ